ncbi:MAG: GNAT family N-acetyltransferase [Defluviitaleaceae bacterium]|nr:GNAT family N-acetyltransferase [Defluviitaleaceae bacterium]
MVKNYNEVLYAHENIKTDRLILRKAKPEDAADLLEYASDPEVTQTLIWAGLSTFEEAYASIFNHYWSAPGKWVIELKESGKMIGGIDIILKPSHSKASFGYALNRHFWGKGYMGEALDAIVKLCFEKLQLNRVEARHYTNNPASGRVMEKAGMKYEGTAKQAEMVKGKLQDVVFYGVTREDYKSETDS